MKLPKCNILQQLSLLILLQKPTTAIFENKKEKHSHEYIHAYPCKTLPLLFDFSVYSWVASGDCRTVMA